MLDSIFSTVSAWLSDFSTLQLAALILCAIAAILGLKVLKSALGVIAKILAIILALYVLAPDLFVKLFERILGT